MVEPGSKILYVMVNQETQTLRVGFESAGVPGTVTELDNDTGEWQIAALP